MQERPVLVRPSGGYRRSSKAASSYFLRIALGSPTVVPPAVIRDFVEAASSAGGDRAGSLVTADAVFQILGPRELPSGEAGASAFASSQGVWAGRKTSGEVIVAVQMAGGRWVSAWRFAV